MKEHELKALDAFWMNHIYALSDLHPSDRCPGPTCGICKALTELTYRRPRNWESIDEQHD